MEQVKKIIDVIKESQATTEITSSIRYIEEKNKLQNNVYNMLFFVKARVGMCLYMLRYFWEDGEKMGDWRGKETDFFHSLPTLQALNSI